MADRRQIGEILRALGRISSDDVERALAHQREQGGYFGEALVALGLVREEELGWTLASQFDLPFVFPDPEAVDPEAAALVSPAWALRYRALPLTLSGDTVTLAVDSPLHRAPVEELERRSGLTVELALAPAPAIRRAIRVVYDRYVAGAEGLATGGTVTVRELWRRARMLRAERIGVSRRGEQVLGWYEQAGRVARHPLARGWEAELEEALDPPPSRRMSPAGRGVWSAGMRAEGEVVAVRVRALAAAPAFELLVVPEEAAEAPREEGEPIPAALAQELRLLAAGHRLVLAVRSDPATLARRSLPLLPERVLPSGHRSVHLEAEGGAGGAVRTRFGPEGSAMPGILHLDELAEFRFDAVTVIAEPARFEATWAAIREGAAHLFVLLPQGVAVPEGVEWLLELRHAPGGGAETDWSWTLEAVQDGSDREPARPPGARAGGSGGKHGGELRGAGEAPSPGATSEDEETTTRSEE